MLVWENLVRERLYWYLALIGKNKQYLALVFNFSLGWKIIESKENEKEKKNVGESGFLKLKGHKKNPKIEK